jgi:pimeloyl-ACP methyl ester carboxylesterase
MTSSYLFINDLRVHYLRWNRDSVGVPVVLLHGLASNAHIWELVAPRLAGGGYGVLAPDLRGHGLTDKPDGDYDFETFHRDLVAFTNALDLERPLLVGHSWGASLALDYAARVPLGLQSPSGIILVDGGMTQLDQIPGATWESTRQRLAPPRLAGMSLDTFLERVRNVNGKWQPDEQAIQIILANFDIQEDDTITPRLSFEHHMQIVRAMWEFKTYEYYDRLRCPVALVPASPPVPRSEGEAEFLTSKERGVARIQSRHPEVKVYWQEDTIHDIPLQRPAELATLISQFAASL